MNLGRIFFSLSVGLVLAIAAFVFTAGLNSLWGLTATGIFLNIVLWLGYSVLVWLVFPTNTAAGSVNPLCLLAGVSTGTVLLGVSVAARYFQLSIEGHKIGLDVPSAIFIWLLLCGICTNFFREKWVK